jgi:hypothetical protein
MNQKAQLAELVLVPADVGREVFSTPFLVLEVPSTECMLGMKLARFAGDTDLDDARLLLRDLRPRFSDPEDIWSHVGGLNHPLPRGWLPKVPKADAMAREALLPSGGGVGR